MTETRSKLPKTPTGIHGLDEITRGGLPKGRPTLICGGAGCGKTLLSMEFLVRGALQYGEPGVFMSFEETPGELAQNTASLGFDLNDLVRRRKIAIDAVHLERSEIEETGEYDLEGLFIRLGHAIDTVHAKRVVLDTVESLFSNFLNPLILRSELRRLFRWLKAKGVTAIITAERGEGSLTRYGLEEYVSDCVILLDHRVSNQITTRRLRVVKYRGSPHGTNEYPFLINENGISVLPVTSLGLSHRVSNARVSSGVQQLDAMLGGRGYFRGSTVMISGTAGSGKTSLAAHFVDAACRRGERVLYFAFEESQSQIVRNMRSIGLDLEKWVRKGLLQFSVARPSVYGLEMHLASMHRQIDEFQPSSVIIDPASSFMAPGKEWDAKSMLLRLVDFLKLHQITTLIISLTSQAGTMEVPEIGISSLIDTWLLLSDIESNGERNRAMFLLKSRGMAHSNQIREFRLTDHGVVLVDVYVGPRGVLTGSARLSQEEKDHARRLAQRQEVERKRIEMENKRRAIEAQIAVLQGELEAQMATLDRAVSQARLKEKRQAEDRLQQARARQGRRVNGRPRRVK